MAKKFIEATKTKPESKGNGLFRVKLITEGWGSSGYYSAQMLEDNAAAFSPGTLSYSNHSTPEELEKGRDITKIVGKYVEDTVVEKDENGKTSLWNTLKVRPEWIDFVEEFKDSIGVSIFISGEASEGEAEGRTGMLVESFDGDDPYKSVDLVAAAGRGGKIDRMLEAYRSNEAMTANAKSEALRAAVVDAYEHFAWVEDYTDDVAYVSNNDGLFAVPYAVESNVVTLDTGNAIEVRREVQYLPIHVTEKEETMADKDIEALTAQVNALAESLATALEALKPAEPVSEETDRAAVVESALKAGLGEKSRKRVLEAVAAGKDADEAIKAEKDFVDEVLAEAKTETEGRIREGANDALSLDAFDF